MKSRGEILVWLLGGIVIAPQAMAANGHRAGIPRVNAGAPSSPI